MINPEMEERIKVVLRDVSVKRDAGTEESYIPTLDLENGDALDKEKVGGLVPGAEQVITSMEEHEDGGKIKGSMSRKGDGKTCKMRIGFFDGEGNFNVVMEGHAKVLMSKLKVSSDGAPVLMQRVRFGESWEPGIDQIGPLFRRLNREMEVEVVPLQLELLQTQKANAAK